MTAKTPTRILSDDKSWQKIMETGAWAALIIVFLIPVQIVVFFLYPPPETVAGFFGLFNQNEFLGLVSLDLLYILSNTILILLYLGLFAAFRQTNLAGVLIALVLGLIGICTYFSSTIAFEMQMLSKQYILAETLELKQQFLAAGQALLVVYKGSSFDVYYLLNAVALLMISRIMLLNSTFSKTTAIWGLLSGFFMLIPSTAGKLGLVFSLVSLIPWIVFSLLVGKQLFYLSNTKTKFTETNA
ncbi:MAG: hypothetical protein AB7E36_09670 [Salinivirgaceae bacterium]